MASGSRGCASAISGRGTSLDLGPVMIGSVGANHGYRLAQTGRGTGWGS